MIIESLNIVKNEKLVFTFSENNTTYEPYFLKRVTSQNWKYTSEEIALTKNKNNYSFDLHDLFGVINPYKEEIFDLYLFKTKMSYKKNIDFCDTFEEQKICLKNDFCDMNLTLYKNSNNSLSIKVVCENVEPFKLQVLKETETDISFKVDKTTKKPFEIFLARRSTFSHEAKYDFFVKCDLKNNQFAINKATAISNIQKSGETYDIVAKCDGHFISCVADSAFTSEYFAIDDEYSAKLFVSEKKFACIYIKRTGPTAASQKKIKVAVLGSCFAREVFHSVDFFNEDYKKFYECGLTGFHHTFVQMMNDPIPYKKEELFSKPNKFVSRYAETLLSNNFLQQLKEYNPEYLFIDTYIESRAKITEVGKNQYIAHVTYLFDTDFYKKLDTSEFFEINNPERFKMYQKAVDEFAKYIQNEMPDLKIIVLRAYMSANKIENGQLIPWEDDKLPFIKFQREIADKNNDYLISRLPNARVIDMRDDKYATEHNKYLDFNFNHLNSQYYKDVLNKFNKIVLQDILKGNIKLS